MHNLKIQNTRTTQYNFKTRANLNNVSFKGWPETLAAKIPEKILFNDSLLKFIKMAEKNAALFDATVILILGSTFKPAAIMASPGTKKEDKQYAAGKSIASAVTSFAITAAIFMPLGKAIHNLGKLAVEDAAKCKKFPHKIGTPEFEAFSYLMIYGLKFILAPAFTAIMFKILPFIMNNVFKTHKKTVDNSQPQPIDMFKILKESNKR